MEVAIIDVLNLQISYPWAKSPTLFVATQSRKGEHRLIPIYPQYYLVGSNSLELEPFSPLARSLARPSIRDALARSGNYADDATTQNRGCTTIPYFR